MEDFNKEFGLNLEVNNKLIPVKVTPSRSCAAIRIAGKGGALT